MTIHNKGRINFWDANDCRFYSEFTHLNKTESREIECYDLINDDNNNYLLIGDKKGRITVYELKEECSSKTGAKKIIKRIDSKDNPSRNSSIKHIHVQRADLSEGKNIVKVICLDSQDKFLLLEFYIVHKKLMSSIDIKPSFPPGGVTQNIRSSVKLPDVFFYTRNSTIVKVKISTWTNPENYVVRKVTDVIKDLLVVDCRKKIYFGVVIFTDDKSNPPFLKLIKYEDEKFEVVLKIEQVIYWKEIQPGIQFWCRDKQDVSIVYLSRPTEVSPQKIKGLRLFLK